MDVNAGTADELAARLNAVRALPEIIAERIVHERMRSPFADTADLKRRVNAMSTLLTERLGPKHLSKLCCCASSGALRDGGEPAAKMQRVPALPLPLKRFRRRVLLN